MSDRLPKGIVPVLQTPFDEARAIDECSVGRLINEAIGHGVGGFLAPAVASEVNLLSRGERERLLEVIIDAVGGRVPVIAGASSNDVAECVHFGRFAERLGAAAYLIAVPTHMYGQGPQVLAYFESIATRVDLPLMVQDFDAVGPGLNIATIVELCERISTIRGIKVETLPAGPKYTEIRQALGPDFTVAGGWAVSQMIEALDRGVDAIMPESSMLPVYLAIYRLYQSGNREASVTLFRQLLPVLAFTNQEIRTSIAFFKQLLVHKGIFRTAILRGAPVTWDVYSQRIADELVENYLLLERRLAESRMHSELTL